jgi:hypothetical protein
VKILEKMIDIDPINLKDQTNERNPVNYKNGM